MNENPDLAKMWKEDTRWDRLTVKQKAILVWFSLSFILLSACGEGILIGILVIANFAYSSHMVVKNIPIKEQKGGVYGK